MAYDPDFYKAYEKYLEQDNVRKAHDWIFKIAMDEAAFQKVVDFGCGMSCEFNRYAHPRSYVGIDVNAPLGYIQADYRHCNLNALLGDIKPSAFVSLFSSEITAPSNENYRFYERVFAELPVSAGLVSGFFYESRKTLDIVDETGGILSYQTLEAIENVQSSLFSEKRIILPVPSSMFGNDVFEVWKIFERQ